MKSFPTSHLIVGHSGNIFFFLRRCVLQNTLSCAFAILLIFIFHDKKASAYFIRHCYLFGSYFLNEKDFLRNKSEANEKAVGNIDFVSYVHNIIPWAGHVNYAASGGVY